MSQINWKVWRFLWRVRIERYYLQIFTPYCALEVRTGVTEEDRWIGQSWFGVRLCWGNAQPHWNYKPGMIVFTKYDHTLGPEYRPKQRWM